MIQLLASEFLAIQPMYPQMSPQLALAFDHIASQVLGKSPMFHYELPALGRSALAHLKALSGL